MKINRKLIKPSIFALLLAVILHCTTSSDCTIAPDSGNAQDHTTAKISGLVYTPGGEPAVDAVVTIKSFDYLPEIKGLGKHRAKNSFFACSTRTDVYGYYEFTGKDSIPEGNFIMESHNAANNRALFWNTTSDSGQYFNYSDTAPSQSFNLFLNSPCVINGTVKLPDDFRGGSVRVYGFDNFATISSSGTFTLDNLPEGNLRLQILITGGADTRNGNVITTTHADSATTLDSLAGIFYMGNDNTGGAIPFVNNYYPDSERVVIKGNRGNLVKTGYVFYGWNTAADGSGIRYAPGDTVTTDQVTMVLYAEWVVDKWSSLTISSSSNGSVNGSGSVLNGVPHTISATHDSLNHLMVWRVTSGKAIIADSFADTTTVILEDGNAIIEGVFRKNSFKKTISPIMSQVNDFQKTLDGGNVIAGSTLSSNPGGSDILLIKTNVDGDTEWTRTYGEAGEDIGYAVQQTSDEGFVITGSTTSFGTGNEEVFLIKTDELGMQTWIKNFGGFGDKYGCSVQQTSDSGFVIGGTTNSTGLGLININDITNDLLVIKTDTNGDLVWEKIFGGSNGEAGKSVLQTNDGGFIIAGNSSSFSQGNGVIYLVKTDSNGDTSWTRAIKGVPNNGAGGIYAECQLMKKASDGGFVIIGGTKISSDIYGLSSILIKLDANCDTAWTKIITHPEGGPYDLPLGYSTDIQLDNDGGYIVSASLSHRYSSLIECNVIKIDQSGKIAWNNLINSPFMGNNSGFRIQQSGFGGYFIVYSEYSPDFIRGNITLVKTDEYGKVE